MIKLLSITLILGAAALSAGPVAAASAKPAAPRRPNIVFILTDDLGWADVGCFGSQFHQTPNIDQLAKQGMRFTDAYAACPVCSPTRASILTGKYPARLHLTDYIPGEGNAPTHLLRLPEWRPFLPLEEITLAEALKAGGYVSASIGKWHLGGPEYFPEHQGFDVNVGGCQIGQPPTYFWPYEGKARTVPGVQAGGQEGEYLTDRLTDAAERFIEQNKGRPFFLYLAHYAVHTPLQAKPALVEKYKARTPTGEQMNPVYAAMVDSVDESVGRILRKLDLLGLADNTLVVFTSDNGGLWPQATSNLPLRAGKGFPYEGGIREPLLVRWPGVIRPGVTCSEPVCSIDFFPTLLEIAGVKLPRPVDGRSVVSLLKESGVFGREALYWHYPHYWGGNRVQPFGAVRAGDWKLIEFYEDMRVELYDLKHDLGESRNLANQNTNKVEELRAMLHRWRQSVDAQMPTPNPNYRPAKSGRVRAQQVGPASFSHPAQN